MNPKKIVLSFLAVLLVAIPAISVIESQPNISLERGLPEAGITPDSWLYGFKRFFESIDLFFTFDEIAKAEKYLKYAELRLAEAKEMAEKGKSEFVSDLAKEYENYLEKANEIAKTAQEVGKNVTKLTEIVAIATWVHVDVLENVLEKVPEEAKPAIERAINSSKKGNEEALSILEKIKPERAAEINLKICEKILAKAREKVNKGEIEEATDLIKEYESRINKSLKIAEIAKSLGNNSQVEQLVKEALSIHVDILSETLERVPEEAKPAIEKAMNILTSEEKENVTEIIEKLPIKEKKEIEKNITEKQEPETEIEIEIPKNETPKNIPGR